LDFAIRVRRDATRVLIVAVEPQGNHHSKWDEAPEQTWFVSATSGLAQAIRLLGRSCGTQDVPGLLLSVFARSDFVCESFTDSGMLTALGKGRDVDENFRSNLSGRDESKAAIIVPFCKRALGAHKNRLSQSS
jgi:hypothetical protein